MNGIALTCPVCHGEAVGISPIINTDNGVTYGYVGYCKSLKCRVRKVTYNKDKKAIHYTEWNNLESKRKFLYETIKQNRRNGNQRYRKKTQRAYEKLKKSFANTP